MAKSVEILSPTICERAAKLSSLRDYIRDRVISEIEGTVYNGHAEKRLPGNINLTFKNISGTELVKKLDELGIAVSAGSACSSERDKNEFLLPAGFCRDLTGNSIRITLGFENTREEADYLISCLKQICNKEIQNPILYNSDLKEKYFNF